jgi:endogenous inhibitor of DNA gyrase (YacG/DUF329 family)
MKKTICPECKTRFDPKKHREYAGIRADFEDRLNKVHTPPDKWIDESSMVKCPKCGNEFVSNSVKFFGILSPKGLKILITFYVLAFLCFALYLVFQSLMEF